MPIESDVLADTDENITKYGYFIRLECRTDGFSWDFVTDSKERATIVDNYLLRSRQEFYTFCPLDSDKKPITIKMSNNKSRQEFKTLLYELVVKNNLSLEDFLRSRVWLL